MHLAAESGRYLAWIFSVARVLFREQPLHTAAAIASAVGTRISRVLAFFLPLKVIILVGTDGIPRYFRAFIEPDDKMYWVVLFSAGTVVFYVTSLVLDWLSERASRAGSARLLGKTSDARLFRDREEAADLYQSVCGAGGALAFIAVGLVGIFVLDGLLFLTILGLLAGQYVVTTILLWHHVPGHPGGVGAFVERNARQYLEFCASVNFLATFGVILAGLLYLGMDNIIIAILSMLLSRQIYRSVSRFAQSALKLKAAKTTVNALVFVDRTLQKPPRRDMERFRRLFSRQSRTERARAIAAALPNVTEPAAVDWTDAQPPDVDRVFLWRPESSADCGHHVRERVYPPKKDMPLQQEHYLFSHCSREALRAPAKLHEFQVEDFQCQLEMLPTQELADRKWLADHYPSILAYFWGFMPPAALVEAYRRARPTLPDRLNESRILQMQVGANNASDDALLGCLLETLPMIRETSATVPLFIHNPDIAPGNVYLMGDDAYVIARWSRWCLEPIGVGMEAPRARRGAFADIKTLLSGATARADWKAGVTVESVVLIQLLWELERLIGKQQYRRAFECVARILSHVGQDAMRNQY